jgi:hypothetical protein
MEYGSIWKTQGRLCPSKAASDIGGKVDSQRRTLAIAGLILISITILLGLSFANYHFVVQNPGGNDFLVHWVGSRALLVDGISPYSDEVALRIQEIAYGRPALPSEHELRVAYPLYSVGIFLPFAIISDYNLARALWMTALEVGLLGLALLSLRLTGWKPRIWLLAVFLLFTLTWYHSARALINGNAVVLVAVFIAGALVAIQTGRDELAGILLALSTIKPQVVILLVVFVWVWAISVRRWGIVNWTVLSLIALSVGAAFFVPDWPLQNLWEVIRYPGYNPPGTPGSALAIWLPAAGTKLGWGLTVLLGILLLGEWSAARGQDFQWFLWTASLTLVASQWIGIQTDPGNFIVLFIPLVLIFGMWVKHSGTLGRVMVTFSMIVLFVGLWTLFLVTLDASAGQPQQSPIMFFPLPLLLLLGLYWVRWWAIRPARHFMDTLRVDSQI